MHEKLHIILFKRNAQFIFVSNVPSAYYYLEMYKNNSKNMFHFHIFVCTVRISFVFTAATTTTKVPC